MQTDPRRLVIYSVLIVLVGLALHLNIASSPEGFLATQSLRDTDAYARTMRVERLRDSGLWFETDLARLNAPDGLSLHWTRPLDILILLPALALEQAAGLDPHRAIFWAGAAIAPLLHVLALLAAAWAARALFPGVEAWFAAVALLANPYVVAYASAGFTDHHMLILLLALIGLGAALRAAQWPDGRAPALLAGGAFGMGVWVSPEALLTAVPVLGAFGVVFCLAPDGRAVARQGVWMCLAMLAVILLALVVERPPAAWLALEYDKVSGQHAAMAALGAVVFALCVLCPGAWGWLRRGVAGGGAAVLAGAVLVAAFPHLLASSMAAADRGAAEAFLPFVREMAPLRVGLGGMHDLLLIAGGIATLPAILLLLRSDRWRAGVVLGLAFGVAALATFQHRRFGIDLAAVTCILAAGLLHFALHWSWARPGPRRLLTVFGAVLVGCGAPYAALMFPADARPAAEGRCDIVGLAGWLAAAPLAPSPIDGGAAIIMTDTPNTTPELAYRTPHRFVVSPYHRAGAAFQDTYDVMTATDDGIARAVLARRGVGYILVCVGERPGNLGPVDPASLEARLRAGQVPGWLRVVEVPATAGVVLVALE